MIKRLYAFSEALYSLHLGFPRPWHRIALGWWITATAFNRWFILMSHRDIAYTVANRRALFAWMSNDECVRTAKPFCSWVPSNIRDLF